MSTIKFGDIVKLSYDENAGDVVDDAGHPLRSFTDSSVVNAVDPIAGTPAKIHTFDLTTGPARQVQSWIFEFDNIAATSLLLWAGIGYANKKSSTLLSLSSLCFERLDFMRVKFYTYVAAGENATTFRVSLAEFLYDGPIGSEVVDVAAGVSLSRWQEQLISPVNSYADNSIPIINHAGHVFGKGVSGSATNVGLGCFAYPKSMIVNNQWTMRYYADSVDTVGSIYYQVLS